jgi:hypothetical protein
MLTFIISIILGFKMLNRKLKMLQIANRSNFIVWRDIMRNSINSNGIEDHAANVFFVMML